MTKPDLLTLSPVVFQTMQDYEHYLPTAFNESMTLLQKVNKVIHEMNKIGKVTNSFVEMWNELIEWIIGEGLEDMVETKLEEWYKNGRLADIINGTLLKELQLKTTNVSSIVLRVGQNEEYKTVQQALEKASGFNKVLATNGKIEILITSGTIVKEQLIFDSINLSHVVISSQDKEVVVDAKNFSTLVGAENRIPFLAGIDGASLPIINVMFTMTNGEPLNDGIYLEQNSEVWVMPNKGVRFAGGYGIRAWDGCEILARETDFSHAGDRGCMISQGTTLSASKINLSHSKGRNAFRAYRNCIASLEESNLSHSAEVNVRISEACIVDLQDSDLSYAGVVNSENEGQALRVFGGSTVYASRCNLSNAKGTAVMVSSGSTVIVDDGCNISNAGKRAIDCYGASTVMCNGSNLTNAGEEAVRCSSNSKVDMGSADCRGCKFEQTVQAEFGGEIHVSSANVSGTKSGFVANHGGIIRGSGAIADNCEIGLYAFWQGEINVRGVSAKNCSNIGADISTGSKLLATESNFTGARNFGVRVFRGSESSLFGTDCRKGNADSPDDIVCTTGSTIRAVGSIGGTNLTPNTISAEGIIFK